MNLLDRLLGRGREEGHGAEHASHPGDIERPEQAAQEPEGQGGPAEHEGHEHEEHGHEGHAHEEHEGHRH